MREEHVDGGFLVTMGIYRGTEDFNKSIVRQLQVRSCRRLPPPPGANTFTCRLSGN